MKKKHKFSNLLVERTLSLEILLKEDSVSGGALFFPAIFGRKGGWRYTFRNGVYWEEYDEVAYICLRERDLAFSRKQKILSHLYKEDDFSENELKAIKTIFCSDIPGKRKFKKTYPMFFSAGDREIEKKNKLSFRKRMMNFKKTKGIKTPIVPLPLP